jgi:hypothetical protein
VPTEFGERIAARALTLVGQPFRLHGRRQAAGLDCVGVIAESLSSTGFVFDVPVDYSMRGEHALRVTQYFNDVRFRSVGDGSVQVGDVQMLLPANRHVHFAIITGQGAVHAHAGLRRVVLTPLPLPWPVIGHWRFIGE